MATTASGVEFHLVGLTPPSADEVTTIEEAVRGWVREGDAVFRIQDQVYAAFATDVPGTAKAARRIMDLARSIGLNARTTLITEPFDQSVEDAASRVSLGQVQIQTREAEPPVHWLD